MLQKSKPLSNERYEFTTETRRAQSNTEFLRASPCIPCLRGEKNPKQKAHMKRIETTIENVTSDISHFYQPELYHFIVMNAVDLGEKIEVQWFFSDYEEPFEIIAFCAQLTPDVEIPSIRDIVSSAWVAEAELVDLIDIKIENTAKGFVLESDSESGPLRKKK